jgi:hypothetical protein
VKLSAVAVGVGGRLDRLLEHEEEVEDIRVSQQ